MKSICLQYEQFSTVINIICTLCSNEQNTSNFYYIPRNKLCCWKYRETTCKTWMSEYKATKQCRTVRIQGHKLLFLKIYFTIPQHSCNISLICAQLLQDQSWKKKKLSLVILHPSRYTLNVYLRFQPFEVQKQTDKKQFHSFEKNNYELKTNRNLFLVKIEKRSSDILKKCSFASSIINL